MQIMARDQQQALMFVRSCNSNQYQPIAEEVLEWLNSPSPEKAVYKRARRTEPATAIPAGQWENMFAGAAIAKLQETIADTFRPQFEGIRKAIAPAFWTAINEAARYEHVLVTPAETVIDNLLRLKWLEQTNDGRLRTTPLGTALLRNIEQEAEEADQVSVVVLSAGDALAYAALVGELATVGAGMLIDPYLQLEQVSDLVERTYLDRFLVAGSNDAKAVARRTGIAVHLESIDVTRTIEVRASTALHDRVVLGEDGSARTIGTSLSGVGKKTTVLTPLPSSIAPKIVAVYEKLWADAEPVVLAEPTD